jgi:hypothetical protein
VTAAPDLRHEAVARDEHASILRSLTHVDWLVLLVVARAAQVGRGIRATTLAELREQQQPAIERQVLSERRVKP